MANNSSASDAIKFWQRSMTSRSAKYSKNLETTAPNLRNDDVKGKLSIKIHNLRHCTKSNENEKFFKSKHNKISSAANLSAIPQNFLNKDLSDVFLSCQL